MTNCNHLGALFGRFSLRIIEVFSIAFAWFAKRELSDESLRLIIEVCPSGMVVATSGGMIILVNAELERQFGYRRDELLGRPVLILVPIQMRAERDRRRKALILDSEGCRIGEEGELFGLHKDGSEFPIEAGHSVIGHGKDALILSVVADITERKRLERLRGEFVATVSHELRTPLTSIYGSLGLIVDRSSELPQLEKRLLEIAHKNTQRMARLLNDILDIEKLESGQVKFKLSQIAIMPLLERAIEESRGFADIHGVQVRLDTTSIDVEVNADPDRLLQVFANLLSNAIKFSPHNQEVLASVEQSGKFVRISVRDRGPGIPPDFKPRMFKKFAQADATEARQKGGTGLGLSIAKQIIEQLGGTVGFEDAPGGGTTFHVQLPSCDDESIDLAIVSGSPNRGRSNLSLESTDW